MSQTPIILASASAIRAELLTNAGLKFEVRPARVDEAEIKSVMKTENAAIKGDDLAELLAISKALDVSKSSAGCLVIGADQTLQCGNTLYDKAENMAEAREKLLALRGNTHTLHSAIAVVKDGEVIWRYSDAAHLKMRDFTPEFLGKYLGNMGDEVLTCVGGYKLEAEGSQLFEKITGDYFTILGLPLLPLLAFLRQQGVLEN